MDEIEELDHIRSIAQEHGAILAFRYREDEPDESGEPGLEPVLLRIVFDDERELAYLTVAGLSSAVPTPLSQERFVANIGDFEQALDEAERVED